MPRAKTLHNIRSAISDKHIVRLKVDGNLRESPFGIPVLLTERLVVIAAFRDFDPDGFTAIPTSRVLAARSKEFEQSYDRVCAALKITDTVQPPSDIDPDALLPLCNTLRRLKRFVIVEAITPAGASTSDDADTDVGNVFYIGKLTGLSDYALAIHNFDANGDWDPTPTTIRLDDVLTLQWDSRYIRTWQRFLELPPSTPTTPSPPAPPTPPTPPTL